MSDAIDTPESTLLRSIQQIQREERLNYPNAKRIRDQEMIALKIRSLISDKEMVVARANRDAQFGDGWLCGYAAWHDEIEEKIQRLFSDAKNQ